MALLGMNVEQADQLAAVMDVDAQSITEITQRLTQQLAATEWLGNDRNTFEAQWTGEFVPALGRVVEALNANANILRVQAEDQRRASS
ncbi:WXG100 family type VII secretion target [Phytoactinopolyspora limicola]|uniref:WXG100 family type VII secretion target n=1 Tax=Phytoactinopolyspora limicola TaxID=2715536 RepID=UPI001A9CA76F|nr:WXG100 family type VII secretion target [Phytoactinopolyspora limicola]